jgi:hypothetical protein
MGSGERIPVAIGLANKFVETAILRRDAASLDVNRAAATHLAKRLQLDGVGSSQASKVGGGSLFRCVPVGLVEQFLSEFRNHLASMLTEPAPIKRYIDERRDSELAQWDVLFPGVAQPDEKTLVDESLLGFRIACQRRAPGNASNEVTLYITNKQRVASRGIEKTGLTIEQVKDAERKYRESLSADVQKAAAINYPDRVYRAERTNPLLIVHLLAIGKDGQNLSKERPVVAWSISFPATKMTEVLVEYIVNDTWMRENFREDVDEEEMNGD